MCLGRYSVVFRHLHAAVFVSEPADKGVSGTGGGRKGIFAASGKPRCRCGRTVVVLVKGHTDLCALRLFRPMRIEGAVVIFFGNQLFCADRRACQRVRKPASQGISFPAGRREYIAIFAAGCRRFINRRRAVVIDIEVNRNRILWNRRFLRSVYGFPHGIDRGVLGKSMRVFRFHGDLAVRAADCPRFKRHACGRRIVAERKGKQLARRGGIGGHRLPAAAVGVIGDGIGILHWFGFPQGINGGVTAEGVAAARRNLHPCYAADCPLVKDLPNRCGKGALGQGQLAAGRGCRVRHAAAAAVAVKVDGIVCLFAPLRVQGDIFGYRVGALHRASPVAGVPAPEAVAGKLGIR